MNLHMTFTAADISEIDCVARVLVYEIFDHQERCWACNQGEQGCPAVRKAVTLAVEWRELRALLTRAESLRAV